MEVGEIRQGPDRVTAWLVVQDGGTNEDPVESAVSDEGFLPVLVCVYPLQEKREDHVVKEEAAMPGAVAGADARDADQARDMLGLHRVDEGARCSGEQRHLAERACRCAERADDGVLFFERFAQRIFVADVSDDEHGAFQITRLLG